MINQDVTLGFEAEALKLKELVRVNIQKKLAEFPLSLNLSLLDNCILSGSSISSIYHGEAVKDYDLWCNRADQIAPLKELIVESYMKYVAEYSENYNDKNAVAVNDDNREKRLLITANAITFKNTVQLITLGDYESCRKGFDFLHCMPHYRLYDNKFIISPEQLNAIKNKKLVPRLDSGYADFRVSKFEKRGWSF